MTPKLPGTLDSAHVYSRRTRVFHPSTSASVVFAFPARTTSSANLLVVGCLDLHGPPRHRHSFGGTGALPVGVPTASDRREAIVVPGCNNRCGVARNVLARIWARVEHREATAWSRLFRECGILELRQGTERAPDAAPDDAQHRCSELFPMCKGSRWMATQCERKPMQPFLQRLSLYGMAACVTGKHRGPKSHIRLLSNPRAYVVC